MFYSVWFEPPAGEARLENKGVDSRDEPGIDDN